MRAMIALALFITGCAHHAEKAAFVSGNAVSVTVNNVWNANQALPIADKHCAQFSKAARLTGSTSPYAFTFDCVTP